MSLEPIQQLLGIDNYIPKQSADIVPYQTQSLVETVQKSMSTSSILSVIPTDQEDFQYKDDKKDVSTRCC